MPRGSTCKAKGCTANKNDNPELSFHSFPRNKERFKLWCDLIQRPDLNHGKAITSRMSMRVCSLHFEERMYMNPTNKSRLIWCAVPKRVEVEGHSFQEKAESDPDPDDPNPDDPESCKASCSSISAGMSSAVTHTTQPSSFILQDSQHTGSGRHIPDTLCGHGDASEKSKVDMESTSETEKEGCDEDHGFDRYVAAEESEKKDGSSKSVTWRTYPGPIQRRVVRTKAGGKRTIMIVKKASLKSLQAKGLIRPLRKYVANHEQAQQALKGRSIIQYNSSSTDSLLECSPSENSVPRKEEEPDRKSSVVTIKKLSTDERYLIEPSIKPSSEQYASSHTSAQALNLQNPNQSPVKVSWENVSGSNALSFTFTVQLPAEASKPASTADKNPLQSETFLLNNGDHSMVSHSKTQTKPSVDPNQTSSSQLSDNSSISSDLRIKDSKDLVFGTMKNSSQINMMPSLNQTSSSQLSDNLSISSDLRIKDSKDLVFGTMKNSSQINMMSSLSPKYVMQSPVVSTHLPISDYEISSDRQWLTTEKSYQPSKEIDVTGDRHSLESISLDGNVSTAALTQKHPGFKSYQDNVPHLSCKTTTGMKNSHNSNRGPEGNRAGGKLTQTRPRNRDNVQWIALPSLSVHQPQPSPAGPTDQVEHSDLTRKNRMSIIGVTSSEQPDVMYKAVPIASLGQKGKRLHIAPSFKSANKELKLKYARLLNKHRHRYHLLLKKYKVLQEHYSAVKDVGTPHQVIRDAGKFLSEEHVLFLESQMFLRNRPGTGNRFSRKFMKLMIEYYKRSAAGYRFLRTIFTIPSVKTIQKWLSKPIECRNFTEDILGDPKEDSETGIDEAYLPPKTKAMYTSQNSNSYENFSHGKTLLQNLEYEDNSADDYDSEESGLEDFLTEEEQSFE